MRAVREPTPPPFGYEVALAYTGVHAIWVTMWPGSFGPT